MIIQAGSDSDSFGYQRPFEGAPYAVLVLHIEMLLGRNGYGFWMCLILQGLLCGAVAKSERPRNIYF
jgi:hypothetical protein